MKLGAFSLSLSVKDIKASREFYEKIGFVVFVGAEEEKWLIMQNENVTIGLFEGTIRLLENEPDKNTLTFNPGWNRSCQQVDPYTDVRDLQDQIKRSGIKIEKEIGNSSEGPGSFVIMDPDGNPILFDQHR